MATWAWILIAIAAVVVVVGITHGGPPAPDGGAAPARYRSFFERLLAA